MTQNDKTTLAAVICIAVAGVGYAVKHFVLFAAGIGALSFIGARHFERRISYSYQQAYSIGVCIAATLLLSLPATGLAGLVMASAGGGLLAYIITKWIN